MQEKNERDNHSNNFAFYHGQTKSTENCERGSLLRAFLRFAAERERFTEEEKEKKEREKAKEKKRRIFV